MTSWEDFEGSAATSFVGDVESQPRVLQKRQGGKRGRNAGGGGGSCPSRPFLATLSPACRQRELHCTPDRTGGLDPASPQRSHPAPGLASLPGSTAFPHPPVPRGLAPPGRPSACHGDVKGLVFCFCFFGGGYSPGAWKPRDALMAKPRVAQELCRWLGRWARPSGCMRQPLPDSCWY